MNLNKKSTCIVAINIVLFTEEQGTDILTT